MCSRSVVLDEDTTGLLLLTDDGSLIHKLTSPKHHVPKVYEAQCKHPVTAEHGGAAAGRRRAARTAESKLPPELAARRAGAAGRKAEKPARPAGVPGFTPETVRAEGAESFGSHGLRLTLTEGKYHQVKRMVAAVGNRVEHLHRPKFGALQLPADLKPGEWIWVPSPQMIHQD